MNKCPEKYRGLSAARECRLRSIRSGITEIPGRLPMGIRNGVVYDCGDVVGYAYRTKTLVVVRTI